MIPRLAARSTKAVSTFTDVHHMYPATAGDV